MTQKICVYTCITGDYDNLNEIKNPEKHIDYYCFTNNKSITSKTWKIIPLDDPTDNWRLARKIKIIGHPIINNNYDIAVWTDANIIWQKPISGFINKFFKKGTISIFRHFSRTNVYDESIACLKLHKDSKESIAKTLDFFRQDGYPDNNGLYESTVYIKNLKDPKVTKTMQIWYSVIEKYSPRDQLSFPYAIWKTNLKIDAIKLIVWDNSWFHAVKHASNSKISDCRIYYGHSSNDFDINKYYVYQYKSSSNRYYFTTTIPIDTNQIEISPLGAIGLIIENFKINPTPKQIDFYGTTTIDHEIISCITHGIITAHGNFRKNQKLSFSIELDFADKALLNKAIENLWVKQSDYASNNQILLSDNKKLLADAQNILSDNKKLADENISLQTELNNILNSKGWRLLEKTRKIIFHSKHQ